MPREQPATGAQLHALFVGPEGLQWDEIDPAQQARWDALARKVTIRPNLHYKRAPEPDTQIAHAVRTIAADVNDPLYGAAQSILARLPLLQEGDT
jgi:hypothetical protein